MCPTYFLIVSLPFLLVNRIEVQERKNSEVSIWKLERTIPRDPLVYESEQGPEMEWLWEPLEVEVQSAKVLSTILVSVYFSIQIC